MCSIHFPCLDYCMVTVIFYSLVIFLLLLKHELGTLCVHLVTLTLCKAETDVRDLKFSQCSSEDLFILYNVVTLGSVLMVLGIMFQHIPSVISSVLSRGPFHLKFNSSTFLSILTHCFHMGIPLWFLFKFNNKFWISVSGYTGVDHDIK